MHNWFRRRRATPASGDPPESPSRSPERQAEHFRNELQRRAHVRRLTALLAQSDDLPPADSLRALLDQMETHAQHSASVLAHVDVALVRAIYVARLAIEQGDGETADTCTSVVEALLRVTRLFTGGASYPGGAPSRSATEPS